MKFENKVCVITGGALGIGRCLTQEFARLGAKVAFVDMDEKAGKENLELIRSAGGEALFFHGDIAEEDVYKRQVDAFHKGITEVKVSSEVELAKGGGLQFKTEDAHRPG